MSDGAADRSDSPLRIAVSGYYGCGNTGDEAVLAGILASFASRVPGRAEFTVLSADPADTGRRHGVRAVDRMSLSALRRCFGDCDLLLSGGGSLLQDTTSVRSLLYYLWVVRLALHFRVPVVFYAQGIGPLRRRVSRMLTRLVADRVSAITVRDAGSAELLRDVGVRRPPIEVTADPAFALQPDRSTEDARRALEALGAPTAQPLLGVALRPWPHGADVRATAERLGQVVAEACRRTSAHPVFLPMQPPGDLDLSEAVAQALGGAGCATVLREVESPAAALGYASAMSAVLAMRLHALIFAAAVAVPMVALSYDPKVDRLMEALDLSDYRVDTGAAPAAVAALAERALSDGRRLRGAIAAHAAALRERALHGVDVAVAAAERR